METRFSNLQSGDTGNVVGFTEGSTSHRSKLLAMGLVRDVPFHEVRKAPLRILSKSGSTAFTFACAERRWKC